MDPTKTKKLLVGHDPEKPTAGAGDFLAVVFEEGRPCLLGLRSRRLWQSGRMVYIGREVTENDLFARLVDTGRRIENVRNTLDTLREYVRFLQGYRIGNVLTLEPSSNTAGFELLKISERFPAKKAL